jgi:gliding motility-associated-like protein
VATPTTTITYTVTGTNSSGCTGTATVTVTVSPPLPANAGPDISFCAGSGGVQLNASGGTTYSWTPATGLSSATISNPNANPAATTTYVVTVGNGMCSATDTVIVSVNPVTNADAGPNDTICSGGTAQLNATGGTIYTWAPAVGLSATNIPNPTASPGATTTYTVTVSNSAGCTSTDVVTITVPQPLSLASAGFPASCNASCNGQTIVIPSGGIQPYSYSWAPGGQTTPSVVNQCAGSYTVTVTDMIGCSDTAIVTVAQPTALSLSASAADANCNQPDGSATVSAAGGTSPYSYLWNDPAAQTTANAVNLVPGNYCVTVTDANGCSDNACITVANIPGVSASVGSAMDATCNAACDGAASINATGGTAPYSYSWAPAGGSGSSATGLCAGSYTVIVTDANNCSDTVLFVINEPLPLAVNAATPSTICIGQCVTLNANASGGTPGYVFTWLPAGPYACPTVTTSYNVTVTDANGCASTTSTVTVTVNPPLNATASGAASICPGASTQLTAAATGGNGNHTYTWLPGNLTGSTVTVTPSATTTYTLIASDNCGTPQDSDIVVITVAPLPAVSFTADYTSGCSPVCVNFTNTSPNSTSASWDFGNGSFGNGNTPAVECYGLPGDYDVTLAITDNLGCTNSLTLSNYITVYANPVADFTFGPQPTTILYPEISFQDSSIGNIVSWQWSFGDLAGSSSTLTNPVFTYPDSGNYQVTLIVTTSEGCTDVAYHLVEIRGDYAFYMPNAFTPNGDGLNDTFFPKGMGINFSTYELMVFDRWGNMLFQTRDWAKEWDGRVSGSDIVLEDIYIWKVTLEDKYGKKHHYIGHVTVIK